MKVNKLTQLLEDKTYTFIPDSNLVFLGFGKDTNGNSKIYLAIKDRGSKDYLFSIQTNKGGAWDKIHSLRGVDPNSLTNSELMYIRDVVEDYIAKSGSPRQKEILKGYKDYMKGKYNKSNLPKTSKPKVDLE